MIKSIIKLISIIAATILFLVAAGLLLYMLISTNESGILMLVDNLDIFMTGIMITGIGLILILIYHML